MTETIQTHDEWNKLAYGFGYKTIREMGEKMKPSLKLIDAILDRDKYDREYHNLDSKYEEMKRFLSKKKKGLKFILENWDDEKYYLSESFSEEEDFRGRNWAFALMMDLHDVFCDNPKKAIEMLDDELARVETMKITFGAERGRIDQECMENATYIDMNFSKDEVLYFGMLIKELRHTIVNKYDIDELLYYCGIEIDKNILKIITNRLMKSFYHGWVPCSYVECEYLQVEGY